LLWTQKKIELLSFPRIARNIKKNKFGDLEVKMMADWLIKQCNQLQGYRFQSVLFVEAENHIRNDHQMGLALQSTTVFILFSSKKSSENLMRWNVVLFSKSPSTLVCAECFGAGISSDHRNMFSSLLGSEIIWSNIAKWKDCPLNTEDMFDAPDVMKIIIWLGWKKSPQQFRGLVESYIKQPNTILLSNVVEQSNKFVAANIELQTVAVASDTLFLNAFQEYFKAMIVPTAELTEYCTTLHKAAYIFNDTFDYDSLDSTALDEVNIILQGLETSRKNMLSSYKSQKDSYSNFLATSNSKSTNNATDTSSGLEKFGKQVAKLQTIFALLKQHKRDAQLDAKLDSLAMRLNLDGAKLKSYYYFTVDLGNDDECDEQYATGAGVNLIDINEIVTTASMHANNYTPISDATAAAFIHTVDHNPTPNNMHGAFHWLDLGIAEKDRLVALVDRCEQMLQLPVVTGNMICDYSKQEVFAWAAATRAKTCSITNNDVLCNAIAVLNRANELVTGHRLRNTQTLAILRFLEQSCSSSSTSAAGHISQINTGEGKTTIISFLVAIKILLKSDSGDSGCSHVDVITSTEGLASESVHDRLNFFSLLGISIANNNNDDGVKYLDGPKKCYFADVVYGSISNFQFDYLLHHFDGLDTFGGRCIATSWVVLDEIDSLLIDQGGNIAKISSPFPGMESLRYVYIAIWNELSTAETIVREEIAVQLQVLANSISVQEKSLMAKIIKTHMHLLQECSLDDTVKDYVLSVESDLAAVAVSSMAVMKVFDLFQVHRAQNPSLDEQCALLDSLHNSYNEKEELLNSEYLNAIKEHILNKFDMVPVKNLSSGSNTAKQRSGTATTCCGIPFHLIPCHLHAFTCTNLAKWIENAFMAKYYYREGEQYKIVAIPSGESKAESELSIVPVDNANTGASMLNTILAGGLHQFLQLKHNIRLTFESLTSCYISNIDYIRHYGSRIYGVTGTLGSVSEMSVLASIYNIHFSIIPPYKTKKFEELPLLCVEDKSLVETIAMCTLSQVLKVDDSGKSAPRAVLVICACINDVINAHTAIVNMASQAGIMIDIAKYTSESDVDSLAGHTRKPADIVVATNIAGRGTDFRTSKELESNGGLHVIVGFLPCNQRVESQAFGRTSRQGNNGSAQLIISQTDVFALGLDENDAVLIKQRRDQLEAIRLNDIVVNKLPELSFLDELFRKFTSLYSSMKAKGGNGSVDTVQWSYAQRDLKEAWAFWLDSKKFTAAMIREKSLDVNVAFNEFATSEASLVDRAIISHNPYYLIALAEQHLENNNLHAATAVLQSLQRLDDESKLGLMYALHIKLFVVAIEQGKQFLDKFARAVEKVILIPCSVQNSNKYRTEAVKHLKKGKAALQIELNYLHAVLYGPKAEGPEVNAVEQSSEEDSSLIIQQLNPSPTGGTNQLMQHLQSRYVCLTAFIGHFDSLVKQLEDLNEFKENDAIAIQSKVPRYLEKIDLSSSSDKPPTNVNEATSTNAIPTTTPVEAAQKVVISSHEIDELEFVGMSSVYVLRKVQEVQPAVLTRARAQIGFGLSLLGTAALFPYTAPVCGPVSGTFISEGITDLISELINQGAVAFSEEAFWKSKVTSYGISIATMGLGALLSSTKILEKAVKACRKLSKWLRECKRFATVCNFLANQVDKLASILELMLTKASFAKLSAQDQQSFLNNIRDMRLEQFEGGDLSLMKAFNSLQKIQKVNDLALSHGQKMIGILTQATVGSVKSVAMSVCAERIMSATLVRAMTNLLPSIRTAVRTEIVTKVEQFSSSINLATQQDVDTSVLSLTESSFSQHAVETISNISLGVLRQSNNWKIQIATLCFESVCDIGAMSRCTACCWTSFIAALDLRTRALNNSKSVITDQSAHTIDVLSEHISQLIFAKVTSLTAKIVTTLPKALYGAYNAHKEHQKVVASDRRLQEIIDCDRAAAGMTCAHDAVGSMIGLESKQLSDATSIPASKDGATQSDVKSLMTKVGIENVESVEIASAAELMQRKGSDRGIAFISGKIGDPGHCVMCVLQDGELCVVENSRTVPLKEYCSTQQCEMPTSVLTGDNCSEQGLKHNRETACRNRILRNTDPLNYLQASDNNGIRYGQNKHSSSNKSANRNTAPKQPVRMESVDLRTFTETDKTDVMAAINGIDTEKPFQKIPDIGNNKLYIEKGIHKPNYEVQFSGIDRKNATVVSVIVPNMVQLEASLNQLREKPLKDGWNMYQNVIKEKLREGVSNVVCNSDKGVRLNLTEGGDLKDVLAFIAKNKINPRK